MWDSMIEMMELVMQHIVEIAILCFEFIGVVVIIISGAKGFWNYVRRGWRSGWNLSSAVKF